MERTNLSIESFLETVEPERLEDIQTLLKLGTELTLKEPKMWGTIVGYGSLHYTYKTGHEGDMPLFGFANRKNAITLYLSYDLEQYEIIKNLGKYKIGKSCLYIKKLSDIDLDVLKKLIQLGIKETLELDFITDNEESI